MKFYCRLAGWNQKEPALMNKFHVGDQLLSVNGQPVTTVAEAHTIMEMTPSGVGLVVNINIVINISIITIANFGGLFLEIKLKFVSNMIDFNMKACHHSLADIRLNEIVWSK